MPPQQAYVPPALANGRAWGFSVNLYALRSERNWGIGDFADLREFVRYAAGSGADIVGVSPLHALHHVEPEAASPYSPTSRFFRNPLYIDVEAVSEFALALPKAIALRERVASQPFAAMLASLRDAPTVQYARVARAKYSALDELYAIFRERRGARMNAFRAYAASGGERLERFAIYQTLTERFSRDGGERSWLAWPADFRDPCGDSVRAWATKQRRRVDFFKYMQWIADQQLADAAAQAQSMKIGLYLDVAVGVATDSADVWSDPTAYVLHESIGAPPDALGPFGQNWGLPPPEPSAMLRDGGAGFAQLLAANMAHAGALRLDHAMALVRLFRIPHGEIAARGRYVAYPFEELLAIAASESIRAGCLIVGEDLGNVPGGFRERMERAAILSYRLLLFERDPDGAFILPERYPVRALATATTHDVPTLVGWAIGRDIDTRERIGHIAPDAAKSERDGRRCDAKRLLDALRAADELDDAASQRLLRTIDARFADARAYDDLVRAAYRFLARTPAQLVVLQLDDALGEVDQVNLPGTVAEYPNWRRKNMLDLARIANDARMAALVNDVRRLVREDAQ